MDNRKPFFLTTLFKRNPQTSEFSEPNGWEENTSDDTRFNGWDSSSPSSTISRPKTNQRSDKPPENDYNGWGGESVSLPKSRPTPKTTNNGWEYENHQDDKYNGWGPGSGSGGKGRGSADWSGESNSKTVSQEAEIDVNPLPIGNPTPLDVESWAPSAPPIPEGGFGENSAANEGGNGGASCVVCWEGPVEGACVPCGHMGSCMRCLREIESRNGTCPICRSKIDKVIRIYAISTE